MAIQKSHGRAHVQLPRSRDLPQLPAVAERTDVRDAQGRFGAGNEGGKGRGWKQAIRRMLGRDDAELSGVAASVANDAWRLYLAALKELPHTGTTVRALTARRARHEALEAFWSAQAIAKLGTREGIEAEERATLHGQRAERLTVTSLDVAVRLAAAERARPSAWTTRAAPYEIDEETGQSEERQVVDQRDDERGAPPEAAMEKRFSIPPTRAEAGREQTTPARPQASRTLGSALGEEEFARATEEGRARAMGKVVAGDVCDHGAARKACPHCFDKLPDDDGQLPLHAMPKPRDAREASMSREQLIERRRAEAMRGRR
jgi:hypothetical protein